MSGGTLYAGPWVGEFGWELCWWNPLLRHAARRFDRTVVSSHSASEYLYEFADEFIPLRAEGRSFCEGELIGPAPLVRADTRLMPQEVFDADGVASRMRLRRGRRRRGMPFAWRDLSPPSPAKAADVLCAFRPPKGADALKSYPSSSCEELVRLLLARGLSVACYGGPDNWCFPGAADMRGSPLADQCSALAAARCACGPSSGTMHLASLCGCPHVTWFAPGTHPHLDARYRTQWNPFGTPVSFAPGGAPEPPEVVARVLGLIGTG